MKLERILDLSKNLYVRAMGKLGLGLIVVSWVLVMPFLFYWITEFDSAPGLSSEAVVLLLGGDFVFILILLVASLVFLVFLDLLTGSLANTFPTQRIQSIQGVIWVLFGLACCIGSWFFAEAAFHYVFPQTL